MVVYIKRLLLALFLVKNIREGRRDLFHPYSYFMLWITDLDTLLSCLKGLCYSVLMGYSCQESNGHILHQLLLPDHLQTKTCEVHFRNTWHLCDEGLIWGSSALIKQSALQKSLLLKEWRQCLPHSINFKQGVVLLYWKFSKGHLVWIGIKVKVIFSDLNSLITYEYPNSN